MVVYAGRTFESKFSKTNSILLIIHWHIRDFKPSLYYHKSSTANSASPQNSLDKRLRSTDTHWYRFPMIGTSRERLTAPGQYMLLQRISFEVG